MMRRAFAVALVPGALLLSSYGCGGSTPPPKTEKTAPGGSKDPSNWPKDDRTMCDWRNKPELEVNETAGPGAFKPNVRRVYKTFGEGDTRHKALVCREIDSNLDGIKDVVRTFNAKGEAMHEEADSDYDGKIDVWLSFVDGRLAEEDTDTNKDGKPDVWKFYQDGQMTRIKRDRNFDGKPDVWEIYTKGHLERMGVDDSFDGHVDRWDRDDILRAEQDDADRKARDALGVDAGAPTAANVGANVIDAGAPADAGAKKATAAKKK
jgi:hypothetical protein